MTPTLLIRRQAYEQIMHDLRWRGIEQLGFLLGRWWVSAFHRDSTGRGEETRYVFFLDRVDQDLAKYRRQRLRVLGWIHSHPSLPYLSEADEKLAVDFADRYALDDFWSPLVIQGNLLPFLVSRDGVVREGRLIVT